MFTAGIGENAPSIREKIGAVAAWLGAGVDHERNHRGEEIISLTGSGVDVLVIHTDEERAVGSELLSASSPANPRPRLMSPSARRH
ncbi:hypothetical protein [Mesorhizobium amorphae]|uniref:hypothetical protein n=1 Tax=Mesorhizobium amorphae TaxID=71433 RepID=UPI0031F50025